MSDTLLFLILGAALGAAGASIWFLIGRQRLTADQARLTAELDASRRAADEQRAALAETQARLRDSFAALSQEALRDNRTEFVQKAEALLQPMRDTLGKVQLQVAAADRDREGSFRAVASQLSGLAVSQEHLRQTTEHLSQALRSPNARGRWGEVQLRRIVEMAGMLEHCDFEEQPQATTESGSRLTPDMIVRLPGDASIVIDSKVPIDAYLRAAKASDDAERDTHLTAHAKQVREHVRSLGSKEYWTQFQPAPEFVVMFLPIEPLLAAAFERDETLLEFSSAMRVVPATPMTLIAILRAVAYGWKQQQLAVNAEEIQLLGRELYDRLATMVEHLDRVGSNIKQAADSYDRFIGSLEQKVLPGARRFKELGVSSTKEIEIPEPLRLTLRKVQKDELTPLLDVEDEPREKKGPRPI
ncbi:MAG: DNA recombination protein RmuC [Acidobacteria bacterium]|jgi:DNA recombination protein RmuC|nr:DNA recombination protein RmuC [Acidobacteriota bacterium]